MLDALPLGVAVVLVLLADRCWRKRPLRRETDAAVSRVLWAITGIGLGLSLAVWAAVSLIEPSLLGEGVWIVAAAWLLGIVAAGRFAMWPVAWRVAESGVSGGALPAAVLWAASACVWFGMLRLVGTPINLASGIVDVPIDALLFLFGGTGVLERSRGWRVCMTVLWGAFGLIGLVLMAKVLFSMGGVGGSPVLRVGSSEILNPGLAMVFGGVLGLVGLTLAAALGGSSARGWCVGRTRTGLACAKCGYNLAGINDSTCPECGTSPQPPAGERA